MWTRVNTTIKLTFGSEVGYQHPYRWPMTNKMLPRHVTSVLLEEGAGYVTVTWGLGDPVHGGTAEYFGYELELDALTQTG
jgi:hypothetical protein